MCVGIGPDLLCLSREGKPTQSIEASDLRPKSLSISKSPFSEYVRDSASWARKAFRCIITRQTCFRKMNLSQNCQHQQRCRKKFKGQLSRDSHFSTASLRYGYSSQWYWEFC